MRIEGHLHKSGRWWAVEVPLLCLYTQGKSRNDAYAMVKDAIEMAVGQDNFEATVFPGAGDSFSVAANDETALLAFALRQQRSSRGLTIRAVATRLGSTSPTAYSAYESGRRRPSFEKFTTLLRAIDDRITPVLTVAS